jgi:hypothetical protein
VLDAFDADEADGHVTLHGARKRARPRRSRSSPPVNDDVLAGKELAQTEEIWYTSKDGLQIQGGS